VIKTWEENRALINGFWRMAMTETYSAEELALWRDDLSGLDQDTLYEAIREVKRTRDTPFPQLAWIHAAYRSIASAKAVATRSVAMMQPAFSGDRLVIDREASRRLRREIEAAIEAASPDQYGEIRQRIIDRLDDLESLDAVALLNAAKELLVEKKEPRPVVDPEASETRFSSPVEIRTRLLAEQELREHNERKRREKSLAMS
jgi:hypothetical protein